MISNEEESPIEIPHRGALAMLAYLRLASVKLNVTSWSPLKKK